MDITQVLSEELHIKKWQAEAAVNLIDQEIPSPLFHVIVRKLPDL